MSDSPEIQDQEIELDNKTELPDSPSEAEFAQRMTDPDYNPDEAIEGNEALQDDSPQTDLAEKVAQLEEHILRSAAEMQNLRNRTKKEIEDTHKYAISGLAKDLIGVLENLRRAQASILEENLAENTPLKNLSDGVDMTANELINVFSKHGIERIDPLGEDFDHNFHQAVSQIPTDKYEAGKIALVMSAGYKIKDRLLRPAMVGIAKKE